jgi:GT2 family glycosyltransferase
LEADASAGLAFGSVVPMEHDHEKGFIVGYRVTDFRKLRGRVAKLQDGGIGANMAVRTTVARNLGFDSMLGAGGYFPSCEDGDFTYRVLRAGYSVAHIPGSSVDHFGYRDMDSGRNLTRQTYMAIGAAYFKHVRTGDPIALLILGHVYLLALRQMSVNLIRRRRPFGLRRPWDVSRGILKSFELSVDRRRALYENS